MIACFQGVFVGQRRTIIIIHSLTLHILDGDEKFELMRVMVVIAVQPIPHLTFKFNVT